MKVLKASSYLSSFFSLKRTVLRTFLLLSFISQGFSKKNFLNSNRMLSGKVALEKRLSDCYFVKRKEYTASNYSNNVADKNEKLFSLFFFMTV